MIPVIITLQVLIDIFVIWQLLRLIKGNHYIFSRIGDLKEKFDALRNDTNITFTRLFRSLTSEQSIIYQNSVCQSCGELLPKGIVRTHDGKRICRECKIKEVSPPTAN